MRLRRAKQSRNLTQVVFTFAVSAILMSVGFLISLPFIYYVLILNQNFHYLTLPIILMILGVIIGGPIFLGGLISLLAGGRLSSNSGSLSDIDTARIRYEVENRGRHGKTGL
jgi:hypothetical protein